MVFETIYFIASRSNYILNFIIRWKLKSLQRYLDARTGKTLFRYRIVMIHGGESDPTECFECNVLDGRIAHVDVGLFSAMKKLDELVDKVERANREFVRTMLDDDFNDVMTETLQKHLDELRERQRTTSVRFSISMPHDYYESFGSHADRSKKKGEDEPQTIRDILGRVRNTKNTESSEREKSEEQSVVKKRFEGDDVDLDKLHDNHISDKQIKMVANFLRDQIAARLAAEGIDALGGILRDDFIEQIVSKDETQVSRMLVDANGNIVLTDYNITVSMPPLSKAIYILLLHHPEGIVLKEMADYKKELRDIYNNISNRVESIVVGTSIEDLCNPESNSINEKMSRIKAAFLKHMSEGQAAIYLPVGERGEAKRVGIDRMLVDCRI